jgi:hypothetical protein
MADLKISLPSFLKLLTSNDISVPRAMALAGKMYAFQTWLICQISYGTSYKECNTSAKVAQVTDARLKSLGIDDKEDRKLILAALRKGGYKHSDGRRKANASQTPTQDDTTQGSSSPPSAMLAVVRPEAPGKKWPDVYWCRSLRRRSGNGTETSMSCCRTDRQMRQLRMAASNLTRFSMKR